MQFLHRRRDASVGPFGDRLRCSGCHINGGLLQKELTSPHNDWFAQTRPLPLGRLKPDLFVKGRVSAVVDAGRLSEQVTASLRRLADSSGYQKILEGRSMQERLRPLFCPMELNIESDIIPFDDRKPALRVPSAFFVDPRLATAEIVVQRDHYDVALRTTNSHLPKIPGRLDADHGWLTPVKARSDVVAIDSLIERGVVQKDLRDGGVGRGFYQPCVFQDPMRSIATRARQSRIGLSGPDPVRATQRRHAACNGVA